MRRADRIVAEASSRADWANIIYGCDLTQCGTSEEGTLSTVVKWSKCITKDTFPHCPSLSGGSPRWFLMAAYGSSQMVICRCRSAEPWDNDWAGPPQGTQPRFITSITRENFSGGRRPCCNSRSLLHGGEFLTRKRDCL